MANIQITDYEAFAKEFIEEYLSRGLGALGKRDIDILVMHLLETHGNTRMKGNQALSIDLQTDVSTIKLLRYKSKLRYPSKDAICRQRLPLRPRFSPVRSGKGAASFHHRRLLYSERHSGAS